MTIESERAPLPSEHGERPQVPDLGETTFVHQDTSTGTSSRPAGEAAAQGWVGKTLGKYQITAFLGQGGMGVVLKAHDPMIDRPVAIKLLADHLAADETSLSRFLAEARAAGKLNHPNVSAIYEICCEGATHYLVLEYLSGGSLSDQLEGRGPFSVLEATRALIDACKGVAAAHAAGVIHRDIKPANFLRAADGSVKVTDFGLAKATAGNTGNLTQAGLVIGTPFFMSPEQCEGKPVDARSDVYSLGATYYSLLTGKNPYDDSDSVPRVMFNHCHGPIPDPRTLSTAVPAVCSRIVARAMAKAPADRYQSAGAMLADMETVAAALSGQTLAALPSETGLRSAAAATGTMPEHAGPARRRLTPAILAGLAVLIVIAVVLLVWQPWHRDNAVPPETPTGEPIKVGVLHSLSGTMANSGTVVVDATLFAIDEINQSGGLLGRQVKAVVADGRSDWLTFARESERLIAKEKVCTVFGCWNSAGRKTAKQVFEKHDHLLIYPVQYEGIETSPCIVYMGAAPNQQILPALDWAVKSENKKTFFLIGSDYVFPRTAHEVIKDHLKTLGATVLGEAFVPLGSQKVETAVAAIVRLRPDMILNTINGDTNISFFRALRAAGVKPANIPSMSFSIGEQELRGLNVAEMVGDLSASTYFQSVATPENEDFVRRFLEKYPQRSVTDPMEAAYVGVKLWAQAVKEAESLEPKAIRRAMLNERFNAPGGEVRIDPDTQHCYKTPRIGRIQADGQFRIVWTAPEPVAPLPYPKTRKAAEWRAFLHDLYTGWGNRWAAPENESPE